jgi:hypothetical protein
MARGQQVGALGRAVAAAVVHQQQLVLPPQAVEGLDPSRHDGLQVGSGVVGQQHHAERLGADRRERRGRRHSGKDEG